MPLGLKQNVVARPMRHDMWTVRREYTTRGYFLPGSKSEDTAASLHFVAVVFQVMLFASPSRLEARVAGGHRSGVGDSPVLSTTSGACCTTGRCRDVLPSLRQKRETEDAGRTDAPSPDQRCSILPVAGSNVAIALVPRQTR